MELQIDGVRVYYEQHGQGEGPDILLLHGWMCSAELWRPIVEALAPKARVTALDFPGHGKSGRPPEPWSVAEYARCTEKLVGELGLDRGPKGCAAVAHSFGGRVALFLGAQRPGLFRKLALTGCAGLRPVPTARSRARAYLYKALRACCPPKGREALRKRFGSADYNALDEEMRKTFVRVVNQDLRDCLPRIQAPTLLYWGENDAQTPLWMAKEMERSIPDAGLVTVPGAGHYAYLERAQEFCRILEAFLLEENE
ncbi:MAG: alpha/beta hydrolase [Clostridia bacterium]|nr:alpha/beta hydrolase [Clostridia bacterium]